MARMIPTQIDETEFNGSAGERRLYEKMKNLPDTYTIFHSVKWRDDSSRRTQEGEADFVIIDEYKGILVIEVKSGNISCDKGMFFQENRNNGEKTRIDPMRQAERSVYFLRNKFKEAAYNEDIADPFEDCIKPVVWFTDISANELDRVNHLPVNYERELLLSNDDVRDIEEAFNWIFDYYGIEEYEYDEEDLNFALDVLAPSFDLVTGITSIYNAEESIMFQLTEEQKMRLDDLEENRIAAIKGGAGTGKTILAIEKAKRLSQEGNVLFLAFNKFLINDLNMSFEEYDNIEAMNLLTLANSWGRRVSTANQEAQNEEILRRLGEHADDFPYDHIVIDEGQDFASSHILKLIEIAKKNVGCCYIFYDVNQKVHQRGTLDWLDQVDITKLSLRKNCRSTKDIADTAHYAIGVERGYDVNELIGEKPLFYICYTDAEKRSIIKNTVERYNEIGIPNEKIVILSTRGTKQMSNLNFPFVSEDREEGKVLYTTVRKYKGLEADAVILIDVDPDLFSEEDGRELFYVGASRAKHYLTIVTSKLNDESLSNMANDLGPEEDFVEPAIEKALMVDVRFASDM